MPNQEFWEDDLEVPVNLLLDRFQDSKIRQSWLDSLSDRQLSIIFQKHQLNRQLLNNENIPIQQKRETLSSCPHFLFNYYLLSYFDRVKLESAVSEIARSTLAQELIAPYLIKEEAKYDKRSLLFLLFHTNHELLKFVHYLDKVEKKGFVSRILQKPLRQLNASFKDFISQETVQQILKDEHSDKCESQLQDFLYHQDRIYMFIRRAGDMDLLINANKIVHGYKTDWIILDFSLNGTQVNICAKNLNQATKIASSIATCYFNCECIFVDTQSKDFTAQVYKFLQTCIEGTDSKVSIFELQFKSNHFKGNHTYLTLAVKPYDPIASELHTLKLSVGDILQYIKLAKIMFHHKKVTLSFKDSEGYITTYYSEHSLNRKEREDLKVHMKALYGLTVLPRGIF